MTDHFITGLTEGGLPSQDNWATIRDFIAARNHRGRFYMPKGRYYVSQPLKLFGHVEFVGQGVDTVITTDGPACIEFDENPTVSNPGFYQYGSVESMTLLNTTSSGKCIRIAAPTPPNPGLSSYHGTLRELWVGAGGIAIDLTGVICTGFTIDTITVSGDSQGGDIGNSILKIGGFGVGSIERLRTYRSVRSTWTNGRPLVEIVNGGTITFANNWLEPNMPSGKDGYAVYIGSANGSSGVNWRDNHIEPHPDNEPGPLPRRVTENTNVIISGNEVFADQNFITGAWGKIKLQNGARLHLRSLNFAGGFWTFDDVITKDATSKVFIGEARSWFDTGRLDDPNVKIDRVFHSNAHVLGAYTMRNPIYWRNQASYAQLSSAWAVVPAGAAAPTVGDVTMPTDDSITFNVEVAPPGSQIWLYVPLHTPPDTAEWRLDVPGTTSCVTYIQDVSTELSTRAVNSLTRAKVPSSTATQLVFVIGNVLQPGKYTLHKVFAGNEAETGANAYKATLTAADIPNIAQSQVTNLVSDLAAKVPTARTLTTTAPLQINGGASADLSVNRTLSILDASASNSGALSAAHYSLLANATANAFINTLVRRDGNQGFGAGRIQASGVTAGDDSVVMSIAPRDASNFANGFLHGSVNGVQKFAVDLAGNVAAAALSLTTDLALADGGTGASTAAGARSNLGFASGVAGSNVTTMGTAAVNVTGCGFNVGANENFAFTFYARVGCSGTGGVKFAVDVPPGATMLSRMLGMGSSATAVVSQIMAADNTLTSSAVNNVNGQNGWVQIQGHVRNGANAGTVQIRFASTTSGQTSTIYADSCLIGARTN